VGDKTIVQGVRGMCADHWTSQGTSGGWKLALAVMVASLLAGCASVPSVENDNDVQRMKTCMRGTFTMVQPEAVNDPQTAKAVAAEPKWMADCASALINPYMATAAADKKAALQHFGFSCPKWRPTECFWTERASEKIKLDDGVETTGYQFTEVTVDLEKKTISISRLFAHQNDRNARNANYIPVYKTSQTF
jgi:hypothetical protein